MQPAIRIAADTIVDQERTASGLPATGREKKKRDITQSSFRVIGFSDTNPEHESNDERANGEQNEGEAASSEVLQESETMMGDHRPCDSILVIDAAHPRPYFNAVSAPSDVSVPCKIAVPQTQCDDRGVADKVRGVTQPTRPQSFEPQNYTWFGLFVLVVLLFSSIASA
ncbi:hypothetical protein [Novipirellula galeiformis]|uniref:hypothetical protein n=1 Tax=Novipirellula galeiformis TaxID=2528004 RepID=UPI0011B6EB3C|nr:hypothetical protein [Novipirellula galeiformis]